MFLEDFQSNLRAIPEENRARFQQAAMNQLPYLVSLIEDCRGTLAELNRQFVVPSDERLVKRFGYKESELFWTRNVGEVLDDCDSVDELLLSMFKDAGVPT